MGTKNNPGQFDCYHNANGDEPMFVLLGRDKFAAVLVNLWACMRRNALHNNDLLLNPEECAREDRQIQEAGECADAMVAYQLDERKREPAGIRTAALALARMAEETGATIVISPNPDGPGHHVTVGVR